MVEDDPMQPGAHLLLPLDGGENVSEPLRGFVHLKSELQRFVIGTHDCESRQLVTDQLANHLVEQTALRGRPT